MKKEKVKRKGISLMRDDSACWEDTYVNLI